MQTTIVTCDACDREITKDQKPVWKRCLPMINFCEQNNGKNFEAATQDPIDLCDDCYKRMLKAMNPRDWPRAEKAA